MVDFNLIIKGHIHGLATKLWSNNELETSIYLASYEFELCTSCLHLNF
jgi:hypothetical protein